MAAEPVFQFRPVSQLMAFDQDGSMDHEGNQAIDHFLG